MNTFKYIFRSLTFYKKQHLAILLGTILSTAILTGALVVGDSVKYSLNKLVEKRLGNVAFAMQTNDRFVSNELSQKLSEVLSTQTTGILKLEGIAINSDLDTRLNTVDILGIDTLFWKMAGVNMPMLNADEVFISENVATRLHLKLGDEVLLRVKNVDVIPINTPFGQEKQASVAFRLIIKAIVDDNHFGRYSLKSNQKAPFNIWVSKSMLENKMGLQNKINTLLIADNKHVISQIQLDQAFEKVLTLEDASLKIDSVENSQQIELTSSRVFIDNSVAEKVMANSNEECVLTYLVNSIKFNSKTTPYSFVSGVSKNMHNTELSNNEIIINDWCANDLGLIIGDSVSLNYYAIGAYRKLESRTKMFLVKSIEPNQGNLFNRTLTPNFPGLSDAASCSEWDTGVPIDLDKIRDKDEEYWDLFKGTPKAIINIEIATQLWGNQFGNYTALRFINNNKSKQSIENELLQNFKPADIGLQFTNVKSTGLSAANKGVNFGELFLSLSFFVITASILLLILVYTLQIFARKNEIGLLSSLGFTQRKIMGIFFAESGTTIILGGLIGMGVGVIYTSLLLMGLNTLWNDAVRTNALEIYINPATLGIGAVSGIIITLISVAFVIKKQLRVQPAQVLKRGSSNSLNIKRNKFIFYSTLVAAFGLVVVSIFSSQGINATMFLAAGALVFVSMVALVNLFLMKRTTRFESASFGIATLVLKNLSRQRLRSLMAIVLLGLGTFSVIITGANRRTFYGANEQRQSGTGGFQFWVENSLPIIHDLNSSGGKAQFNFADDAIVDSIKFIQMLTLDGDDASCLNLNQVQNPRILGLNTNDFAQLNPFSFSSLIKGVDGHAPWLELNKTYAKNIIPAYADQTVITWGLMKKIGDTLLYKDEFGADLKLLIAGGLNNSVFQGNILIADTHFRKHFPSQAGSKVMLIDSKTINSEKVASFMDSYFKDYGIEYTLATQRLAEFNSVENTYLNVFMLLGGLGVAIGTLGFGIILLRNKLERRHELALLSAVGINNHQLFKLVFIEHFMLLVTGLGMGILAAFVGILPSLLSPSYALPGMFVSVLIFVILLSGLVSIYISARVSNNSNIISALRNE